MVKNTASNKAWWQSVTVWAGVTQIASGMGFTAFSIDWETGLFHLEGNLYDLWQTLLPILTGVATIYGRVRAKFGIAIGSRK